MNAYDSIERGVVDEGERRRPRTFTLTQLLVACVVVCVCSIAATTAVHAANAARASRERALAEETARTDVARAELERRIGSFPYLVYLERVTHSCSS